MPILKRADAEIYYEVHGAGFPILLYAPGGLKSEVNMWGGSSPAYPNGFPWMDPRTALSDKYTVIAMDQRNAGRSVADVKPDHGWHTFAADHLALMDHLGFKKFHVMGGCIGGSYCFEAIEQAPDRVAAAVLQNPIGLWENRENWDAAVKGYGETVRKRDPAISQETIDSFGRNMFGGDFVFSVTRDFVRNCRTPLYLQPGTDKPHPAHTSAEIAELAPNIEVQKDWRGPEFLQEFDPARARLSGKEHTQVMMRRLALAALFSAAFIIPSSAQQQTWVAVASDGAGLWGVAVGMATRQAAETSALGECGMYCKLKFTAQARCVAYAFSETGRAEGFSAGASLQQVEQPAWAECNANVPADSCKLKTARCFE